MPKKNKNLLIIALIPARSGSVGVKDKNIRKINGKPLIYYTIKSAKKSKYIDRIIVSTDSEKYIKISKKYGAETPFLRPKKIARAKVLDYPVMEHALKSLGLFKSSSNVILVFLRPTMPLRSYKDIDSGIKFMLKNNADCIRSVRKSPYSPYWTLRINKKKLIPFMREVGKYQKGHRRQDLPETYICDGYIDAIKVNTLFKLKTFPPKNIFAFKSLTKEYVDIDTEEDFKKAEMILNNKND
tara:strand:- start:498 stop:1220 length:723 start_codon:yes stop_codon:yes gene_type:complete